MYILITICTFLFMTLNFLYNRGLFETLNRCLFEDGFKENYFLNMEEPLGLNDMKPSYFNIIHHVLFYNPIQFDSNVIFSTTWFQIVIVFYGCLAGIEFHKYWTTISKMEIHRNKSFQNYTFRKALQISLKVSISVFISYFLFLTFMKLISSDEIGNGSNGRSLFSDMIGNSLYQNNTYLYFLLEGCVRFFLIPFVYSMFSCLAVVMNRSIRIVIGFPLIYYFGFAIIGVGLYMLGSFFTVLLKIGCYVNPTIIMVNGDYNELSTPLLIILSMIPLYISIVGILIECKDAEI